MWAEFELVQVEEEKHEIVIGIWSAANVEFVIWNLELKKELTV